MLLMIDNYDSFTYNLVQYFAELGVEVRVVRNDEFSVTELAALRPKHVVLSPGPCTPNEAGVSMELVRQLAGEVPILGVCLGHQAIGQVFGGHVVPARELMHGKTSPVVHNDKGVFSGLVQPFAATRYHSLVLDKSRLPSCFEVTAWTEVGGELDEIMGIRHRTLPLEGVQFHPESILSEHGHQLLRNFLQQ
jgi:anthranilate synthase component 2